jgi:hypothetical protein
VAEQERSLGRAADVSDQQQQQLAREQEALAAAAKQLDADRAAAADKAQELERQRRSNEAARRCGIVTWVGNRNEGDSARQ